MRSPVERPTHPAHAHGFPPSPRFSLPRPIFAAGWALLALLATAPDARAGDEGPIDLRFRSATSDPGLAPIRAARAALASGHPADALTGLEDAPRTDARVRELAQLLRAQALALTGKPDAALALVKDMKPPAPICGDLRADLMHIDAARLAATLSEGRPADAAARWAALPAAGDTLARARALYQKAKDEPAATRVAVRLLVEVPESKEARDLAAELGAAGVAKLLGDPQKRAARVRQLLDTHQNEAARDESDALLETLGPKPTELFCELAYIRGKALRKLRTYTPALKALSEARTTCAPHSPDFALRAALLESQVRGIRGQVRGTKLIADWILKRHGSHSYADDALLTYAETAERAGRDDDSIAAYRRILNEMPDGDQASTAAWRLAFRAIRAGDAKAATPLLQSILARPVPRSVEHDRARYWLARLAGETERRALFEATVEHPSFYAWLALDHLRRTDPEHATALEKRLITARDDAVPNIDLPPRLAKAPQLELAVALFGANAPDLAEVELRKLACTKLSDDERVPLALAFDAIGAYPAAQRLLRGRAALFEGAFSTQTAPRWFAAYSRPYLDLMENAAGAEKLESLLLIALSREESTFDPEIVSWAGATGLAQLMPATAVGAYASVFGGKLDPERLTDPELNLRLGARVLKEGMRGFGDREPLALAAYNGGHGLARKFLPSDTTPFEIWVETISVKETRRYVKRVTETWGIYRLLYDRTQPFIRLPETIGPSAR